MKRIAALFLILITVFALSCSAFAEDAAETMQVDGTDYYKLFTVVDDEYLVLTDPQFDALYAEGNAEAGIKAILAAGNVYVNGQRIPYGEDLHDFEVGGSKAIWQVDGGWAWSTQKIRNWEDTHFMPELEGDSFVPGQPVDFETAAFLYTKYLSMLRGQTVELWAEEGSNTVSLITTTFLSSTFVTAQESDNGVTRFYDTNGEVFSVEFPTENVADDIEDGDMIVYWLDGVKGWCAKKAVKSVGHLVENTDPNDPEAIKHPLWLEDGATETVSTTDSLIGKSFAEAFRHTQFIRGQRRTDQYNVEESIIMWSSDENEGTVLGFSRGDAARAALEHAIAYAEETTANVVVSADGSDVSSEQFWVTEEIWNAYATVLEEAKALAADESASNFALDTMTFELGNVLGGTEDKFSNGPMKMNPLGVVGSMEPGTAA